MNRFRALLDHLDDRINPMVVKELRQAVRGRFVPLMLCRRTGPIPVNLVPI